MTTLEQNAAVYTKVWTHLIPQGGIISPALANCALNDSCGKITPQENASSPLEVKSLVSISSVTRMTSPSPANRKSYWQEKSSPWSSIFCKNEVSNSLRRRPSLRTWSTALISSDKTCADILTGNCSSSLPRRMLKPSWMASDELSKLHMACLPPTRSTNSTQRFVVGPTIIGTW